MSSTGLLGHLLICDCQRYRHLTNHCDIQSWKTGNSCNLSDYILLEFVKDILKIPNRVLVFFVKDFLSPWSIRFFFNLLYLTSPVIKFGMYTCGDTYK